jgi:hypothetical protein
LRAAGLPPPREAIADREARSTGRKEELTG